MGVGDVDGHSQHLALRQLGCMCGEAKAWKQWSIKLVYRCQEVLTRDNLNPICHQEERPITPDELGKAAQLITIAKCMYENYDY
jgi:hypothetical protein